MRSNKENEWDWCSESEPQLVLNRVEKFFDYDNTLGRLRWTSDHDSFKELPLQIRKRFKPEGIVGMVRTNRDYELRLGNKIHPALQFVWEKCTGHRCSRVMTISPRSLNNSANINNLCLIPDGLNKIPKSRARCTTVVAYEYHRKQFTTMNVDSYYNETVLSYHDKVEDALEALNKPVVSFL